MICILIIVLSFLSVAIQASMTLRIYEILYLGRKFLIQNSGLSTQYFLPLHSRGVWNADKKIRSTASESARGESQNNQPPFAWVRS